MRYFENDGIICEVNDSDYSTIERFKDCGYKEIVKTPEVEEPTPVETKENKNKE